MFASECKRRIRELLKFIERQKSKGLVFDGNRKTIRA
jgi:hypothetical protein